MRTCGLLGGLHGRCLLNICFRGLDLSSSLRFVLKLSFPFWPLAVVTVVFCFAVVAGFAVTNPLLQFKRGCRI